MEAPTEHRVRANGIELAWFEWGATRAGRAPTILLAHATGFHARCWDPVVRHLDGRHVVALDQRGHGRSERTAIRHWKDFGRDLAAFVEALDLRKVVGVGHSMGGHAMVDAAAACADRFERLVLLDPVIAAPGEYGGGGWTLGRAQHPTAKRKNRFPSVEAMIERFRNRPPYSFFVPEALRAYCTWGLVPAEDGDGFVLACPPEIEASVYMTSRTNPGVHQSARALSIPVLVVRARLPPPDRGVMDFSSSPTWPDLVHEFANGREIHLADRTHFIPMEIPAWVAERVLEGDPP